MASKSISRLTLYTTGQPIKADEHNAEHQMYVYNLNELFKSFDYDGVYHYLFADKTKFTFSNLNLEQILSSSHNSDGTIKATKVKDNTWSVSDLKAFLDVAHHPDGTIKSDGISDTELYNHNHDVSAHPEAFNQHDGDILAHKLNILKAAVFGTYRGNFYQEISYDVDGNPVQIDVWEDDTKANLIGSVSISYDTNSNPIQIVITLDGATITQDISYDTSGNIVSITQTEA